MKKTGKAVTIMQRSTDATWEYYTMNVLIKNDVLKLDGTRFIDVVFLTEPNQLGYYPRQNDIIMDATNMEDGYVISANYSRPANEAIGVMFLSKINDGTYRFAPIMNLSENVYIPKGSYLPQVNLANAIMSVWNFLTGNNPYLKNNGSMTITSDITKTSNYSDNTESTIDTIFKNFITRLHGAWDIQFTYYIGETSPRVAVTGSAKNNIDNPNYFIDLKTTNVLEYVQQSRNASSETSMVLGYTEDGSLYNYYAVLDENFNIVTSQVPTNGIINVGSTPRVAYASLQNGTLSELVESATSLLKTSIYAVRSQMVMRLDGAPLFIGQNDSPFIGQYIRLVNLEDNIVTSQLREINFTTKQAIVGDNDDITFGD